MKQIKIALKDIAGTVVLYNSPVTVLDNIATYINQVKKLYVVDNSIRPNYELNLVLKSYPNVHYQSLDGNKGIATALNWAAKQAIFDGFTILLTMDDDTRTPDTMILQMIDFWNNYTESIGILSGIHRTDPAAVSLKLSQISFRKLPYTLTSGNMLSLTAYKEIGGFWDKLFIDHVDHEYGLRLNANGYQVVELKNIELEHNLGYRQEVKIGDLVIRKYGTHSPVRLYYFARNGIYLARLYFKLYPKFWWIMIKEITKRLIKASFLDKGRANRLKMIAKGIRDGWRGQLGPYIE